jgi:hypothetical protein
MEDKLGKGKKVLECVLEYMREKGATLLPFINYSLEKNNLTFIAEKEDGAYAWPVLSFDYQPDRSLLALRFCFPVQILNESDPKQKGESL